jgi:GNAT superfamily N-acetyltransferase
MPNDVLYNPVFNALSTGDRHFANGTYSVKYFHEEVSPFVGFPDGYEKGFDELHDILPEGRRILYAIPIPIQPPRGWKLAAEINGLQFVFDRTKSPVPITTTPVELNETNVEEMIQLATLTKPGPFNSRTIEFGFYHGIFEDGRLAAMTGQRLHVDDYTEISAVCTHPDFLGKGYAGALMQHQIQLILSQGKKPFLHVREDNARAIGLYERLGFRVNRKMNFYFMKRE